MKMMKKLLDNVNKGWKKYPMEQPAIEVSVGSGVHTLLTITTNQLHLHSTTFRSSLTYKQSIYFEDMTIGELNAQLKTMGYGAEVISSDDSTSCLQLMPVENVVLFPSGRINVFTSPLWKALYPVSRLLEEAEGNVENAIRQMYATSTRGRWLDYWASFFALKRATGEDDLSMARRIFMTIVNLKTNDIAIEELLKFSIKTEARVVDLEPSKFEVQIEPDYITYKLLSDEIIDSVKGAGIDFVYHYIKNLEEHYPAYMTDKIGSSFAHMDSKAIEVTLDGANLFENIYGWKLRKWSENEVGFTLNSSKLNVDSLELVRSLTEGGSMTMTDSSGNVVQSLTF